jgi:hypothetical protein
VNTENETLQAVYLATVAATLIWIGDVGLGLLPGKTYWFSSTYAVMVRPSSGVKRR